MSSLLLLPFVVAAHAGDNPLPTPTPVVLLQAWATVYDQDEDPLTDPAGYGDPEDDMGVKIRRARLGFEGQGDGLKYLVLVGASAPHDALSGSGSETVGLVEAYAGVKVVDGVWVTGGLQKVPVSREVLISAEDLAFTDRSVATHWLVPDHDAGLLLDARYTTGSILARLRAGGFNGNGSALGDDNSGKLVAARGEVVYGNPEAEAGQGTYSTYGAVDGLTAGVAGNFWRNGGLSTKTTGFGGDALVRVAGLAVLVEVQMSTLEPVGDPVSQPGVLAETSRMGLTGQLGYTVKTFEPVVRYSSFDDDRDETDQGDVTEVMAGLTWHPRDDLVRIGGGYVLRLENGGAAAENDSARLWMQLSL